MDTETLDFDNESSLNGSILRKPAALDDVLDIVRAEDFTDDRLKTIFDSYVRMHENAFKVCWNGEV